MRLLPHSPALALALLALAASAARAQGDPAEAPRVEAPAPSSAAPQPPEGGLAGRPEPDALAVLRALEARLSLGQAPTAAEARDVVAAAGTSPHVAVRALAVAVLAWLDPATATSPLLLAWNDAEPRVRAGAAQSLLSLARRLGDEDRRRVVADGLGHLDDPSNEVACASVELLGALAPSAAADAVRSRADIADDVRYACFARVGGLPLRAIELPPIPAVEPEPTPAGKGPPALVPAAPIVRDDGTLLLVSTAAAAGFVAGGLLPAGFVPSRDVLTYDDDASRITREEVAAFSQLGAGLLGAAALGAGAWGVAQVSPGKVDEAAAVAVGTAALGLAGASAPLAFSLREGPGALVTAGGLLLGVGGGLGLAAGFTLDVDDAVLASSAMALGGLAAGLTVFTAVPVGLTEIPPFGSLRTDFGLGVIGMGAGVAGFTALALGGIVDVRPARTFAVLAGGAVGGGLGTALGFIVTPPGEVESRIACGVGLAGLALGITAGVLVPEEWLPAQRPSSSPPGMTPTTPAAAVVVTEGALALGVPVLVPLAVRAGDSGLGATLVYARF